MFATTKKPGYEPGSRVGGFASGLRGVRAGIECRSRWRIRRLEFEFAFVQELLKLDAELTRLHSGGRVQQVQPGACAGYSLRLADPGLELTYPQKRKAALKSQGQGSRQRREAMGHMGLIVELNAKSRITRLCNWLILLMGRVGLEPTTR